MAGSLEGKVVLVTGAGRGIGREVALLAALEGAAVIVNDLGVGPEGEATQENPAQEVVSEIVAAGGRAVVNGDSITDPAAAEAMIRQAVDTYGKLDAVINNAGFLRDRIFHKMSQLDWKAVIDVHLNGYFNVSRAAATLFREQEHGNFVHFTSTSGLVGNFGQSSYAAAKLGVVGLSKSIALDMERYNVRSNCIAPFAWTAMTASVPTDTPEAAERMEKLKRMEPRLIAPLAVYLGSDGGAGVSGQVFGVRANEIYLYSQSRVIRSVHRSDGWTPESIAEHAIPAMRNSFYENVASPTLTTWDPI